MYIITIHADIYIYMDMKSQFVFLVGCCIKHHTMHASFKETVQ